MAVLILHSRRFSPSQNQSLSERTKNLKKPRESQVFLSRKRLRRLNKENLRTAKAALKHKQAVRELILQEGVRLRTHKLYTSEELEMIIAKCPHVYIQPPRSQKYKNIRIPEVFSIVENPISSLSLMYEVAYTRFNQRLLGINLDYSSVTVIDLAAETILDVLITEFDREAKARRRVFRVKGYYPESDELERYIRAIGIIRHLDVKHERLTPAEEDPLNIFQMRSKRLSKFVDTGSLDYKSRAVKDFVDHINECLNRHGRELTASGRNQLSIYTGEIIGNAEEHSGIDDWAIVGYLDNASGEHISEIAIFNFGQTIAESFSNLPKDSYAYSSIEPYIRRHMTKGFFGRKWTIDNLITLAALQGNISSKNQNKFDTRGQGTVELIEFFQRVHSECISGNRTCAKMAILSGNTHILFDGTYKLQPDELGRNVLAFNSNNDLSQKPDERYIKNLGNMSFPGTIIGIRFPMIESQTKSKA